jgi:8-oxo-dGTP diphosphatase
MGQPLWPGRAASSIRYDGRTPYAAAVPGRRIDCVGAVVTDGGSRLLLVLRGQEPARGTWSVPGGRVESGESDADATAREVLEETGLRVVVDRLAGTVERAAPGGGTYVIRDYVCFPVTGSGVDLDAVRGGDDAEDARWFTRDEVRRLPTSPGLVEALAGWGLL